MERLPSKSPQEQLIDEKRHFLAKDDDDDGGVTWYELPGFTAGPLYLCVEEEKKEE